MREGDRISSGEAEQAIAHVGFFFLDESKLREAEELSRQENSEPETESDELIGTGEFLDEEIKSLEEEMKAAPAPDAVKETEEIEDF